MRFLASLAGIGAVMLAGCALRVEAKPAPEPLPREDAGADAAQPAIDGGQSIAPGAPEPEPAPEPAPDAGGPMADVIVTLPFRLEAEKGTLVDNLVATTRAGYSGDGYVTEFQTPTSSVTFKLTLANAGQYKIVARAGVNMSYGPKTNDVWLDGARVGQFKTEATGEFVDVVLLSKQYLSAGPHELSITKNWGYFDLDYVELREPDPPVDVTNVRAVPVNPNASPEARRLLRFLADNYGKKILAGQQDLTWYDDIDMVQRVYDVTSRLPAVVGYDFMNYDKFSTGSGVHQVEEAIDWWNAGGVVTFCWHWRQGKEKQFYADSTSFRINLTPGSPSYEAILADIDALAVHLKRLQAAGVPILWRPLHEASGGWFWWGASGPDPYIGLYRLLYDRLTNYHHIDNLLWVWNGQSESWYPGDDYADVIGYDLYDGKGNHSSRVTRFEEASGWVDGSVGRIVAITENGAMPDPDALIQDRAFWSYFVTWNDRSPASVDDYWSNPEFTSTAMKLKIYNHPYVLTRDELPDLKTYPLPP